MSIALKPDQIAEIARSIADSVSFDVQNEIENSLMNMSVEDKQAARRDAIIELLDEMGKEGVSDEFAGNTPVDEFARRWRREVTR